MRLHGLQTDSPKRISLQDVITPIEACAESFYRINVVAVLLSIFSLNDA
jgi:hypothetical protein